MSAKPRTSTGIAARPADASSLHADKGSLSAAAARPPEAQKIACGRKHFAAIDVDFAVATNFADVLRGGDGLRAFGGDAYA